MGDSQLSASLRYWVVPCYAVLFLVAAVALAAAEPSESAAAAQSEARPLLKVAVRVDLGKDTGQNFGSLFEAVDARGNVVAGAGFLGAYNTIARSNRRTVHFFVRPAGDAEAFTIEPLPRPSEDTGTFLFDFNRRLLARSYSGGADPKLRRWDTTGSAWVEDDATTPLAIHLGDGVLECDARGASYKGERIFELDPDEGSVGRWYYAEGVLFFRIFYPPEAERPSRLVACRWTPDAEGMIDPASAPVIEMRPTEFPYAFGQLGGDVLAATNVGGVHRFDGTRWETLIEGDPNTSFQIYSMINYYDRLLMGQYPTGNLFEYDGERIRLLDGEPPRMPGVSSRAREAQTAAIYRGDLFVGVWPWGEVWRYDRNRADWDFVGRMFTHPPVSTQITAPYEKETAAVHRVYNLWGQRVKSMVPWGDSLYISTSAKGSYPFDAKFDFLADGRWKEYGSVYRLTMPGSLSVHTEWKDGPTRLEFTVADGRMSVAQDGKPLGSVAIPAGVADSAEAAADITGGKGVFGPLRGDIAELETALTTKGR